MDLLLGTRASAKASRERPRRVPRGYAPDHPRSDLLRGRRLTVAQRHEVGPWLQRAQAGARIRKELDAAAPLVRWLRERVGPSQRAAAAAR